MDQLELPLQRYDIFTDQLRPVSSRDFEVYQEAFRAYNKVRVTMCSVQGYAELIVALDAIHDEFKKRINL